MVSLIVRSAGSCVLPARFGGRRLLVVAAPVPGHAALLAGWSVGTSAAGLDSLRAGKLPTTGASTSTWALKAAGRPPSVATGGNDDYRRGDSELVRKFKVALMAAQVLPAEPSSMELPVPHYQAVMEHMADSSFALWVEVANRLRPPTDTKIHEGLHRCGDLIVAAAARKRVVSWKRARDLAEGLELLRRIVSSALQAPLPLPLTSNDWTTWQANVPDMEHDSKNGFFTMLQYTYQTVKKDIHSMFYDKRTTN